MSSSYLAAADYATNALNNLNNALIQYGAQKYQKNLQNKVFEREDSAVQRRVSDLEASGLSKTLAAGSSAGAGSLVSGLVVPQMQGTSYLSRLQNAQALKQVDASIKNTQADTMNKMREGAFYDTRTRLAEAQVAQYEQNVATQQAQVALYGTQIEKMNKEMGLFTWTAKNLEANIAHTQAQTEHELKKMGYTDAQIETARAQAEVFRKQAQKMGVDLALAENEYKWKSSIPTSDYVRFWQSNLTSVLLKNKQQDVENYFMYSTGSRMPTFNTNVVNSLFGTSNLLPLLTRIGGESYRPMTFGI